MCASLVECFSYLIVFKKLLVQEVSVWRTLSHDYVLPFIGVYYEASGHICRVSPFMENGTLSDWRHDKNPSVAEIEIRVLILDCLLCMIVDVSR